MKAKASTPAGDAVEATIRRMGGKTRAEESSEGVIDEIFPEYAGAADEIGDSAKGKRGGDDLGEGRGEIGRWRGDGVSGSGGAWKGS